MNYSFHPHAEKELEEIEKHYDAIREALGNRFRAEFELTIVRIIKFQQVGNHCLNWSGAVD